MQTPTDRAELFSALARCASDRAYDYACPIIDGVQYWDPIDRAAAYRAAAEFETAAVLWAATDPASARDCRIQARTYRCGAVLADYPQPVATLVAVNGQPGPDGDYLIPWHGRPAGPGETHLEPWQAAALLADGYQWAHESCADAPVPTAAVLATIATAAPKAPTQAEPSLADELAAVTAELVARHDAALAAAEATLARVKALVAELAELD